MKKFLIGGLATAFMAAAAFVPAAAIAKDFYKGKRITLIISAGPGGGYATYVLTTTKHMRKHIPGNPEFVRKHRQGAGGVVAANYLAKVAKRDGTVIATVHRAAVSTSAVYREKGVTYDPREFSWIGSINKDLSLCVSYHTTPVKTFNDLFNTPLIVGGLGPGSDTDILPNMFNNLFGTKFKLITGYNQGTAITLAMERGEVQGRCGWSWSSINATKGDWLRDKKINLLVIGGLTRPEGLPADIPMVRDMAKTQAQKDVLELIYAPQEMARPVLGPPGMPADRLKILRTAFDATMKDPAFLAEAKARRLDISPITGKEIEVLVARLMDKPADIVNAAIDAISRKGKMEIHFKKQEIAKIQTKIDAIKRGGRQVFFKAKGGAKHEVGMSGSRSKVMIGGKAAKRGDLKPGMSCTITYTGNKSTAKLVVCN
ncbi:MAG: tripartite-type tricarboxylate transporter receptor subunit TctC [Alphaproteobacteria bacterium]|jgi:tripartite-type tricarboxylate transporter receptor subunit TctC